MMRARDTLQALLDAERAASEAPELPEESSDAKTASMPEAAYVYPVHRLDRGTSGALAFALTEDAARSYRTAFDEGRVEKVGGERARDGGHRLSPPARRRVVLPRGGPAENREISSDSEASRPPPPPDCRRYELRDRLVHTEGPRGGGAPPPRPPCGVHHASGAGPRSVSDHRPRPARERLPRGAPTVRGPGSARRDPLTKSLGDSL
ncbi:hypothetical protein OUZ56_033165 [Daphnia magna]|uniref:Pseudouridine synthase RsuA/RluA-like domain-containing protein n=1 Tax=Daphnia magna TaxID=35525 RepID=A0ABR0BAD7_9CRUS|nr:hypothetical protein OUZ56_033165 [Daphnia magna]